MARRRTNPLPRGITVRRRKTLPDVYLISYADQTGAIRQELAGTDLREAARLLAQRRKEVEGGTYAPGGASTAQTTLATFAAAWLAERRDRGVRSVRDDEIRWRLHIEPSLGKVRLGDLRPQQVAAWIEDLRRKGTLGAKTIRNVHGTLHGMMETARFRELIVANPASLPRGMLPRSANRKGARFTRDELWQLLTDERIEAHRRVFYALMALGGLRCGEASGRRWRDLDTDTPQFAALTVASQYVDAPLKTAKGDDTAERIVPVHPALAEILTRWRRHGYAMTYGSAPRPDDWICPAPASALPRTRSSALNGLLRDCARIGVEPHGCHAFRRAFISLARSDGARADVLEAVTHNARGAIIDVYTSLEWSALCEAVGALRFELTRAPVIEIRRAANDPDTAVGTLPTPTLQLDAELDASVRPPTFVEGNVWRRRESNPSPEVVRDLSSTCVVRDLMSLRKPPTNRLLSSPSILFSRPHSESREIGPVSSMTPPVER